MNATADNAPRPKLTTQLLAIAALASWTAPPWCLPLRYGTASLAHIALPVWLSVAAACVLLRLVLHRHAGDFGIFLPSMSERGSVESIRLTSVLLLAFNLGAAGFMLHDALAHTTLVMVILLSTVSSMNLADECWIARRRRLNRLP
jgi:membrane protein YdbS with pleckstrin-like domain